MIHFTKLSKDNSGTPYLYAYVAFEATNLTDHRVGIYQLGPDRWFVQVDLREKLNYTNKKLGTYPTLNDAKNVATAWLRGETT